VALGRGRIGKLLPFGQGLAGFQALFDDPRTRLAAVRQKPPMEGRRLLYQHAIWCREGGATADLVKLRHGPAPTYSDSAADASRTWWGWEVTVDEGVHRVPTPPRSPARGGD